ncbi:hypothetical protein HYU17_03310 [Candidatus Woesearchaeota archaeon]|nr:hypothetical protein [Candidatus Woesearchaeota archaeon]
MIVINTEQDIAATYMLKWTTQLIERAKKNRFNVVHIKSKQFNRQQIESRIAQHRPKFIFFNGHGTPDAMVDEDWSEVINTQNSHLLKKTVTFARACDCLSKLGADAVRKGCISFIGYKAPFWIPRLNEMETRALQDRVAGPVLENSNIIAEELIDGGTVESAVEKAHKHAAKTVSKLMYSPQYANDPFIHSTVHALLYNDVVLGYAGDGSSTIRPEQIRQNSAQSL